MMYQREDCKKCMALKDAKSSDFLYLSKKFAAQISDKPHVDRKDGGHIKIMPRWHIWDRKEFSKSESQEFILLAMMIGDAMYSALPKNNIKLTLINYQDNGNWSVDAKGGPHLHLHLYGRAKNSKFQKHGQALVFPPKGNKYYKKLKPLNKKDEQLLKQQISRLLRKEKYSLLKRLKK